ncbi:MAG: HDIG domain-containing protein, partial [Peptoniphilus harei]|nr:HDIG domain-containing protein [Peptoniphilus harei]
MNNKEKLQEIIAFLNENTRFKETKNFIQHGNTSVYTHVISVAKKSIEIAEKYNLDVDMDSMIRGALLHDYFL